MKETTELEQAFLALSDQLPIGTEPGDLSIIDLLPAAVYTCNADGIITNYNKKAAELWGRNPAIENGKEKYTGASKLYYPDGKVMPIVECPEALTINDGIPRQYVEVEMERPDLSKILVKTNVIPLKNASGETTGILSCFSDVTEERKLQKELEWQARILRDYIDNATIGLHWVDENGIIKWANKAELDLLGYTSDEYIGKHISEFHADEECITDILTRLKCNENLNAYEARLKCKNGDVKTVLISSNVLWQEGKFVHTRCFTVDVSDRIKLFDALRDSEIKYKKLYESLQDKVDERTRDLQIKNEELKRSEERYHKMVEEVEDYAIILLDKDGIIQNWNKGAENIKGYKDYEIVGKSFENFYLEDDVKRNLPKQLLNKALTEGKAIHEGWRKRKDGSRFWGSIVLTAVHDNTGSVLGFTKVTRDLTERKLAEDKMKEYTDKLEFQNKELEQFAYAASHDMKEPLRKIHIYNSIVLDNVGDRLDEKSRDYLKRSINAASKMSGLIEDLLVYSRTTSSIENTKPVDLNEIMQEFITLHKEDVEHHHVQIQVSKLPVINGVAFQLKQLFNNIISNSIKYKHPDRALVIKINSEITEGCTLEDQSIDADRQYYNISITDNGIGFEQQYAERIFDIFERLHNASKTQGTGIGLAICKRIMQNHDGCIKASGKLNEGARFDLYFPIN